MKTLKAHANLPFIRSSSFLLSIPFFIIRQWAALTYNILYIFIYFILPFNKIGNNLKFYPLTKALHVKNDNKWCSSIKEFPRIWNCYIWITDLNGMVMMVINIVVTDSYNILISFICPQESLGQENHKLWHKSVWEWMPSWYLQWIQFSETWIFHTSLPYSTI